MVSTDPAHSLADCFAGCPPVENLVLRELDPQESLGRFKARHEEHLRTIALRGTFLDQADVAQLLDLSVPGLDEVMALLEIVAWVKEERYACIVVDTAQAGHTLRLLGLPALMRQWVWPRWTRCWPSIGIWRSCIRRALIARMRLTAIWKRPWPT